MLQHSLFDLLLAENLQSSPRHIRYDVPASINQSDICRLHERVDAEGPVLEDGTPVRLRFSQTVSSEDAHVNQELICDLHH